MEGELVIYDQKPLTAKDIRSQVNLIQEVMKSVMTDGTHYGKIPGCGDKPTLLKPGAEKLISTFNLCPRVIVEDLSKEDIVRYRIICRLETMSGKFVGDGVGECSSEEDKYKWREAVNKKEWDEAPEDRKREKWKKGYQSNPDYKINQVRTNPSDLANTILKMAKKRALVDATLTRTGASDIFTQDIEDMGEEYLDKHPKPTTPKQDKPEAEKPKTKNFDFLKSMAQAKTSLGEEKYYEILTGQYGHLHANLVVEENEQMEIYNEMKKAYKEKAKGEGK